MAESDAIQIGFLPNYRFHSARLLVATFATMGAQCRSFVLRAVSIALSN